MADYIPFDHTYIVYDPNNPLTLVLALSSIVPILLLVFLFSWFVVTRELECCIMAAGQVVNDVVSTLLKKVFKFDRPVNGQIFKKDGRLMYGMPSSHSQFIAFFSVYLLLKMKYQWPQKDDKFNKAAIKTFLLVATGLITYSRVFFEYHNLNQILVGCTLGAFMGSAYFFAVSLMREYGLTDWLLSWRICKLLYMKDTVNSDHYRTLEMERKEWEESKTKTSPSPNPL